MAFLPIGFRNPKQFIGRLDLGKTFKLPWHVLVISNPPPMAPSKKCSPI